MKNFVSIAIYLISLTQKDVPFDWTDKCEKSFQKLKTLLITSLILSLLVKGKIFVYCDASQMF